MRDSWNELVESDRSSARGCSRIGSSYSMPEQEFIRRVELRKAQRQPGGVTLGPLFVPLPGGSLYGLLDQSMETVNDVSAYRDVYTFAMQGKGCEEACVNALSGEAQKKATGALQKMR